MHFSIKIKCNFNGLNTQCPITILDVFYMPESILFSYSETFFAYKASSIHKVLINYGKIYAKM